MLGEGVSLSLFLFLSHSMFWKHRRKHLPKSPLSLISSLSLFSVHDPGIGGVGGVGRRAFRFEAGSPKTSRAVSPSPHPYLSLSFSRCYIGITESPHRRFGEHSEGGGQVWKRMVVLVQAASSSTTASLLECELLREFGGRGVTTTVQEAMGAPASSPHFLYMLLGGENLFRRSR